MNMTDQKVLHCTEVWGGNLSVDNGVVMAGLDAWLFSQPSGGENSGGDVHYVSSCSAGVLTRMLVADVAGHGEKVSSTAARLRQLMRRYVNFHSQNNFVRAVNREFAQSTPAGRFATCVVMTYDAWANKLTVSNAGHPPPLVYHRGARTWSYIERPKQTAVDIPFGIEDGDYSEFSIPIHVDDLVMLYTDSLPEARDTKGQLLGTDGVLTMMRSLDVGNPSQLVPQILGKLGEISPNNLTNDDITILLFRPNGLRPRVPFGRMVTLPFRALWAIGSSYLPARMIAAKSIG
jgi:serine phosphatase RsbU (regulator of sigma subunit)